MCDALEPGTTQTATTSTCLSSAPPLVKEHSDRGWDNSLDNVELFRQLFAHFGVVPLFERLIQERANQVCWGRGGELKGKASPYTGIRHANLKQRVAEACDKRKVTLTQLGVVNLFEEKGVQGLEPAIWAASSGGGGARACLSKVELEYRRD